MDAIVTPRGVAPLGGQIARSPAIGDPPKRGDMAKWLGAAGLLYATPGRTASRTLAAAMASEYEPKPVVAELVIWAIEGQRSGHEWMLCGGCGELRMAAPGSGVPCRMTPACPGPLARLAPRPRLTKRVREALRH